MSVYDNFMDWKTREAKESFSESVLVEYFEELAKKYKPSTLWGTYSMLKATIKSRHSVDMTNFNELRDFLKINATNYESQKANVLSAGHVEKFLNEAPDIVYLATKVGLNVSLDYPKKSVLLLGSRIVKTTFYV